MKRLTLVALLSAATLAVPMSAQTFSEVGDRNTFVYMESLPLCSSDFFNFRYNHFLPPNGYLAYSNETGSLPYFSLIEAKGRVKAVETKLYKFTEEFGERKESLSAINKATFNDEGHLLEVDYKPWTFSFYVSHGYRRVVNDGGFMNETVEYDGDGRVSRRYPVSGKDDIYMDYTYDEKGRVSKISFETGNYSQNGDNIKTFRYTYNDGYGPQDYIRSIEHFEGTKLMTNVDYSYNSAGQLSRIVIKLQDAMKTRKEIRYEYDMFDTFSRVFFEETYQSSGDVHSRNDYEFEGMWGNGVPVSRWIDVNHTYYVMYSGGDKKRTDSYQLEFDEKGNWTTLEYKYGKYVRQITYSDSPLGGESAATCLTCEKPMGIHTAFCPECGAEQAVVAGKKRILEQEQQAQREEQAAQAAAQKADDAVGNTDESGVTDSGVTAPEEESSAGLFLIAGVVAALLLVAVFMVRRRKKMIY